MSTVTFQLTGSFAFCSISNKGTKQKNFDTGIGGVNAYSVKRFYNRLHDAKKEWMELRVTQTVRPIQEAQQESRGVFSEIIALGHLPGVLKLIFYRNNSKISLIRRLNYYNFPASTPKKYISQA